MPARRGKLIFQKENGNKGICEESGLCGAEITQKSSRASPASDSRLQDPEALSADGKKKQGQSDPLSTPPPSQLLAQNLCWG